MTDKDTIKAYEGLTPRQQLTLFRNLYYNDGYATERGIVANAINDILPEYARQQAEIERLRESYSIYEETTGLKQAKADAIREFAEMMKKSIWKKSQYADGRFYFRAHTAEDIDNLVKEMTEDKS